MDIYSGITVDPMVAANILKLCIRSNTTAMMWGKPGVGKTSLAHQVAKDEFDSVITINPSQDDVIDLKLPFVDSIEGETVSRFAISERLPRKGRHLIFVDEINTAPMSMQATLYSLILEGRIGSYTLPKGCVRFAAGNRIEDKCAANEMSLALKDRLGVHMNIVPSEKAWIRWATINGVVPEVIAFVRDAPQRLEALNPNDPCAGCTPRSLEYLSNLIKGGIEEDLQHVVANGTIGMGAGAEFVAFLDIFKNKIDFDEIFNKPSEAKLYSKPDLLYSVVSGIGAKINADNVYNAMVYLKRLDRRYMIMAMTDAFNRDKSISANKEFAGFIRENFKYFI